jgi:hypothetical protein
MAIMRMADHGGVSVSDVIDRMLPGELDLWEVYATMFGPPGRDRTDMQTATVTQAVLATCGVTKPLHDVMVYKPKLESEEERKINMVRSIFEMGKRLMGAEKARKK